LKKKNKGMVINLEGKKALVCGGSKGIGRAIALSLAEAGAEVFLLSRSMENMEVVLAEMNAISSQHHTGIEADLSNLESIQAALYPYLEAGIVFHVLINNSSGPKPGPAHLANPSEFAEAFTQHLISAQVLLQLVLPGMKASGFGRIINVISTSVKQPLKNLGVSNTIRGAVANWAKTLSSELAPFGITVNNVLPGATATDRLEQIIRIKSVQTGKSIEETVMEMYAEIPAARFALPEEIANAVCFLASSQAAYINGINLPVDGGRTGNL
jgi:3-oxoacyl-[acyl-carrier protein] reductase